jgi:hypothetical protein
MDIPAVSRRDGIVLSEAQCDGAGARGTGPSTVTVHSVVLRSEPVSVVQAAGPLRGLLR